MNDHQHSGSGDNVGGNKTINLFFGLSKRSVLLILLFFTFSVSISIGLNSFFGFIPKLGIINLIALLPFIAVVYILTKETKRLSMRPFYFATLIFFIGATPYLMQQFRANYYSKKGNVAIINGFAGRSNHSWKKAIGIYSLTGPKDKYISTKIRVAESYFELGQISKTKEIIAELNDIDDLSIQAHAELFGLKGNMFEQMGDYTKAEHNYQLGLQCENISDRLKATLLLNKSTVLSQKGPNYLHSAKALNESARMLYEKDSDFHGLAISYLNMASLVEFEQDKALKYLDSASYFARKVNSTEIDAVINSHFGLIHRRNGEYSLANEKYLLAQNKYETTGNIIGQAQMLLKRAYLDIDKSNYSGALQKVKDANSWIEQYDTSEYNPIHKAELLSIQAELLQAVGKIKEAEELYKEAILILDNNRSYNTELNIKINYASFLQENGRINDLAPLQNEISNLIFNEFDGQANQQVLVALNNLAKSYQDQNELERAEKLYSQALEISLRMGDKFSEANTRENLAIVQNWLNRDNWQDQLSKALFIYENLENKSATFSCLYNIYVSTGKIELLDTLFELLLDPGVDQKTKIDVLIGIHPNDLSNLETIQKLKLRLESILNIEIVQQNDVYIASCHMRIAQIEQIFGNFDKILLHIPWIEERLAIFPYPKNKIAINEFALLKYMVGDKSSCVAYLFDVFDLNSDNIEQQTKLLNMISIIWNEIEPTDQRLHLSKLNQLNSSNSDAKFKDMLSSFKNRIGVDSFK